MINIRRLKESPSEDAKYGHFGILRAHSENAGILELYTHEKPWIPSDGFANGHPIDSCIPVGSYSIDLYKFKAFNTKRLVVYNDTSVFKSSSETSSTSHRYGSIIVPSSPMSFPCGVIGIGLSISSRGGVRQLESGALAYNKLLEFLSKSPDLNKINITWAN